MIDVDNIERLQEISQYDRDLISSALNHTKEFIRDKELILYGGLALDYALKAEGDIGIYRSTTLPDYDFMSPTNYEHSIELGQQLKDMGFLYVSSINAIHVTTRRIRVNFFFVADITYIPREIYDKIPFIIYDDLKVIHPIYQRMDLHSSLSFPFENPPQEVISHRIKKDFIRLGMIDSLYPIERVKYDLVEHTATIPDNCIVTGFAALALYQKEIFSKPCKIKDNKITFNTIDKIISLISNDMSLVGEGEYYEPFLEVRPMKYLNKEMELYIVPNKYVPYNVFAEIKVVSFHYLCLYFLQKYNETGIKEYASIYRDIFGWNDKKLCIPRNLYGKSLSITQKFNEISYLQSIGKLPREQLRAPEYHYDRPDIPSWEYKSIYYKMSGKKISRAEFEEIYRFYAVTNQ